MKGRRSPLLYPVRWERGRILVLDETLLPFEERYIEVSSLEDALCVLREMRTRAFGQVLLFLYTSVLVGDPLKVADAFHAVRPTFDFHGLSRLLEGEDDLKMAVEGFLSSFDAKRKKRAETLSGFIKDGFGVLTICNVSGELTVLHEVLREQGKHVRFYVSETRPYLQGTRLTYWELTLVGAEAYLICDNQAAQVMERGMVDVVVVGSDRSTTSGDIINKVGTYALAVLSKIYSIPFYVLCQFPKDVDVEDIEIEERPSEEVFMWLERKAERALYPSFDVVRSHLITGRFFLA